MAAMSSMPAYLLPGVPVHQPSHLEGDASLATEILPGPPSLLSVVQQSTQKRDLKKPVYSYLHPTDPGSTYSGIVHGTIIGQEETGRNLKGKRSTVTGRAQRASARNHNGAASAVAGTSQGEVPAEVGGSSVSQPISVPSEPYIMVPDDESSLSRSNSAPTQDADAAAPERKRGRPGRPKGKGKAKETELPVRIKEEPEPVSLALPTPEPLITNQIDNEDHCSSCRSHGALVYCDGCPRAFHLWCLNPPMERIDEDRWFCPACVIRQHPPRKPPPGLFSPLIHLVQTSIPSEYQLPEEIRTFFKDGSGPALRGRMSTTPSSDNHGQIGLVSSKTAMLIGCVTKMGTQCCASSAALPHCLRVSQLLRRPPNARAGLQHEPPLPMWKFQRISFPVTIAISTGTWTASTPPLPTMPPINKKWMCPNHADRVLLPKLRIPKQAAPIEITKPKQFNNGIIEIIHPQTASTSQVKKVAVDEVLINGRRYRVPERIVILDFWNKVGTKPNLDKDADAEAASSGLSSPLTSLSSLDDSDERIPIPSRRHSAQDLSDESEDLKAAQMLCNFQLSIRDNFSQGPRLMADRAIQTESEVNLPSANTGRVSRATTSKRGAKPAVTNGHPRTPANPAEAGPSTSTAKRKRNINGAAQPPTPSTRELRPRSSRQIESMLSISSKDSSLDDFFVASTTGPSKSAVRVKMEDHENGLSVFGGSPASPTKTTARGRPIRRPSQKGLEKEEPPKRGRKRKEMDDVESEDDDLDRREAVEQLKKSRTEKEKTLKGKEKEKPKEKEKKNPSPTRPMKGPPASTSTSSAPPSAPAPATPSLKIRLPRLSDIAMHTSPENARG
ncbi:Histone deacetylase associated PHD protein-2 [Mycena sanguinolenta]|uniref:Histone deacetylase associated PHD protein-2 n=1 Tax=Mycena sanguinolenta TaxID=230812 RepID=A0A8H7D5E2_9AGAR|nr:Histone deacetylase associated PHD protein-2 [Mycena sanguinolenta]